MAGFVLRTNQRLKKLVSMRYHINGIDREGTIKDLSLSGSYVTVRMFCQ